MTDRATVWPTKSPSFGTACVLRVSVGSSSRIPRVGHRADVADQVKIRATRYHNMLRPGGVAPWTPEEVMRQRYKSQFILWSGRHGIR